MRKSTVLRIPKFGNIGLTFDPNGAARIMGDIAFISNLSARVIRNGKAVDAREVTNIPFYKRMFNFHQDPTLIDLGSGLVTNVGVMALANEAITLASPSGARINLLFLANQHVSGKGTTGAAATDIKLETISTNGGQTAVAGAQTLVSAANLQKLQTVATIAYSGTEAVTEWGLLTDSVVSVATGSPFTAGAATTGTSTGTALTASSSTIQGHQQHIVERTSGTNLSYGLISSNSTSVFTVPAWYLVATGLAGQAPANTETYVIRPVMWDHKVFSAINVVSGDSVQYTYALTVSSGG